MKDKELERRMTEILLGILTALIILMALFPVHAFAVTTVKLQYGQCITVRSTKYCAPAKNVCPICTPVVCPTQKPCPTQSPCNCPTQVPCPVPTPCPELVCPPPLPCPTFIPTPIDTSQVYWYAISSLMLACSSTNTWGLPAEQYVSKFVGLDVGEPVSETTEAGCFVREWTKAKVIVNPMDAMSCSVALDGTYKDLNTGLVEGVFSIVGPKQGKVLVK